MFPILNPPPSPYHPSGSSQCTSPEHPVSCIEPGLAIHFIYDIIHVSMPFSQNIPASPSPTESKRLFYTSVSLLLSCIQGYHYLYSSAVISSFLFFFFSLLINFPGSCLLYILLKNDLLDLLIISIGCSIIFHCFCFIFTSFHFIWIYFTYLPSDSFLSRTLISF